MYRLSMMQEQTEKQLRWYEFQQPLVWRNVIGVTVIHVLAVYALFLENTNPKTWIWDLAIGYTSGLAITAGAHRLWTHRTYKARLPLRIFLMCGYMIAGQYSLMSWARDHRLHHKHSDTDGDPHNATRGFFFSHCGWLMMKRHPESKRLGKAIDVSDLMQDPVVAFQQKYFYPLHIFFFFILPLGVPAIFWQESWKANIMVMLFFRYAIQLNSTWIVNSAAHFFGNKPYNRHIKPTNNRFVAVFALGEGWHNFHHVFPWDYRNSEYGLWLNVGGAFLDLCAWLGLAYDLKTATPELVAKVVARTGSDPHCEQPYPENHVARVVKKSIAPVA